MAASCEPPVCRIVVDTFERSSGIAEVLRSAGVEVELRRLPVADYAVGDDVLVERKTIVVLCISLRHGRLWRQVGELREAAHFPYLVLEGINIEASPIDGPALRGVCLAIIGQGTPVIFSRDPIDSAAWLRSLASRRETIRLRRDRPAYAQRLQPRPAQVREAMLAAVPGVSVSRARALLKAFGSVAGVARAGREAWPGVPSIGPATAEALDEAFS